MASGSSRRASRQRDDPRGERHRRARGDEPLRCRSALADLPAADDVAERDQRPSRAFSNIPQKRSHISEDRASPRWSAKKSTWARGRWSSCAGTRGLRARASASPAVTTGICFTRTGRRFFNESALETALLARVRAAFDAADCGEKLGTDWVPGLRADALVGEGPGAPALDSTRPSVSAAAPALTAATSALTAAAERGGDVAAGREQPARRTARASRTIRRYVDAYRRYCWRCHVSR